MGFSVVVLIVGAVFAAIGLIGGGIKLGFKEGVASIPTMNPMTRILSFGIGAVFIAFGLWREVSPPNTSLPAAFTSPTLPADTRCQGEEKGANIAGAPVLVTDWKADCAYRPKLQGGETVTLTTWGIILTYAGETIISTRIIPPNVEVTVPANSALFAGYRSREGVEQAYQGKNPNAPTPAP
jgi:hypothetical protein